MEAGDAVESTGGRRRADALAQSRGGNGDGTEGDGTLVTARGLRTQGGFAKHKGNGWGRCGRLDEKSPQLCPLPSDGDPVASVGVSKVSTGTLVSIGYGPFYEKMTQTFNELPIQKDKLVQ